MDLANFLDKFEYVRLANQSDNQNILNFYSSLDMKNSSNEVCYDRSPDFFKYLKHSSLNYYVFLLLNKNEQICGVGTILLRSCYINGIEKTICYLGDLRVSSLKMTVLWRRFYAELISDFLKISEFQKVSFNYTAILNDNIHAQKALLNKKNSFKYTEILEYEMINILRPFSIRAIKHIDESEVLNDELAAFYTENLRYSQLAPTYTSFHSEIRNLKNIRFLSVRDKNNNIIASTYLWSPYESKKIIIKKFSIGIKLFYLFSKIFYKSPKLKFELRPLYFNCLTFSKDLSHSQKQSCLKSLINFTFKSGLMNDFHVLTFSNNNKFCFKKSFLFSFHNKIGAKLYNVSNDLNEHGLIKLDEREFQIDLSLI